MTRDKPVGFNEDLNPVEPDSRSNGADANRVTVRRDGIPQERAGCWCKRWRSPKEKGCALRLPSSLAVKMPEERRRREGGEGGGLLCRREGRDSDGRRLSSRSEREKEREPRCPAHLSHTHAIS